MLEGGVLGGDPLDGALGPLGFQVADLPEEFQPQGVDPRKEKERWIQHPFGQAKDEFEKLYITRILEESNWNVSEASRRAGMFRQNLQQKIRKYGIRPPEGKDVGKEDS